MQVHTYPPTFITHVCAQGMSSYMIGTANLNLDPLSVLASLVPLGLLEKQCIEVSKGCLPTLSHIFTFVHTPALSQIGELRAQLGRAKGECEGALGQRLASEEVLQLERKVGVRSVDKCGPSVDQVWIIPPAICMMETLTTVHQSQSITIHTFEPTRSTHTAHTGTLHALIHYKTLHANLTLLSLLTPTRSHCSCRTVRSSKVYRPHDSS